MLRKFSSLAMVRGDFPLSANVKILRRCGHSSGFGTRRFCAMTFFPLEVSISMSTLSHMYP
jgi:hypothetical protein